MRSVLSDREGPQDSPGGSQRQSEGAGSRRSGLWASRLVPLGTAFAAYLIVSLVLWWGVWSTHPTSVTTCGCGDAALFTWFLAWPAHAIAHGQSVVYSTALFHPTGINLLSNTSVLAIGIPLAPVTWLFGPVATLNVASTLGPAITALAMFWLLRRWVRWPAAAFLGGLLYGFSPYVVTNLAIAHLMTGVLVLVPLIVACLDELFVRQRRRPAVVGGALGLLITVQFFLSTEVLAIAAISGALGVVVLVVYAVVAARRGLIDRVRHALTGLGAAAATSLVLLAYPVWFALVGPAHLSGLVWPNPGFLGTGIAPGELWNPAHLTPAEHHTLAVYGGYQGTTLPAASYLGLGIMVVLVAALIVWRRDRRLWFFGGLGTMAILLSFGVSSNHWTPWRIFVHIPLLENILPARFMTVATLCVATMLAIVVDRVHGSVRSRAGAIARRATSGRAMLAGTVAASLVALAVGAAALVPLGQEVAASTPLTTQRVIVPQWFAEVAPHLPPGQVVLTYPAPFSGIQSSQTWQAVGGMHFAQAGGGGPQGIPSRAGEERAGFVVLAAASFGLQTIPSATPENVDAVRRALRGWGVTMVVVPDPAGRPQYDSGASTPSALALFTAAIGRSPRYDHGAWTWGDVRSLGPATPVSTEAFQGCTTEQVWRSGPQGVPACIMAAARSTT